MILPPLITDLPPVHQMCIYQTAQDYNIPPMALMAIWAVEGGKNGESVKNKDGSSDYGVFQINTFWVNKFSKWFNINKEIIRDNFCMNVRAAGYIIRYSINFKKGNFWDGIGMYHSMNSNKAHNYKLKVKQASDIIYDYHQNPHKYTKKYANNNYIYNQPHKFFYKSLREKLNYKIISK